ncbi:EamA family transporter [Selenihalanaerobacter shriftii]|uniref:EamA-like transporter family protein n=1 Tax=Selenihalanaerobacter shriftii TaxID=142842 RepID=A0A1T4QSZ3_9FIRM|nr:EamA family transporter [Selenihalanaerobacter shriftii]SKA06872.1 EamA-like transporter family protein [Selenihalanaerobacter shriftii]
MFMYVASIILIVISNIMYNVSQKATPSNANPFSALFITYLTAAILTIITSQFYKTDTGFFQSFNGLNWTSIILGISIVGLEFGYLLAYRAGWDISVGSLVANVSLAIMLIPIGVIFFNEGFGPHKILGIVLCIIGLIIINR